MKKILFSSITLSMLLSTGAFAATTTADTSNTKNVAISTIQDSGIIHIDTQDPRG
jgi:hypothetical protein